MSKVILILVVFLSFNGKEVSVSEIEFLTMESCIAAGDVALKAFNIKGNLGSHRSISAKAICVYR